MSSAVASDQTSPPITGPVPGGIVAAVAGALVLALCNVLSGFYPATASTRDMIVWFGANPGPAEATAATGLVAAALLVPGIWAVTGRLRAGSPVWAGVGGWLMSTGYLCSTVLSIETLTLLGILAAGGEPGLLAAASDEHTSPTQFGLYVVFGLGALVGTVVLGVAMLRRRGGVPAWAAWAMIASAPVRMIGLVTGLTLVGPPLASVLIAVGFAGVLVTRR